MFIDDKSTVSVGSPSFLANSKVLPFSVAPVTYVSVIPVISIVTASFLVKVMILVTLLYVPPVTNVLVSGGMVTWFSSIYGRSHC